MTPARLHQIARDERARRKAAWDRAGQGQSERARYDDALWSNIEQMAGLAAGDPACAKGHPQWWLIHEQAAMARNVWATVIKAEATLDASIAANGQTIASLWHLYRWLKPRGWSPFITEDAA